MPNNTFAKIWNYITGGSKEIKINYTTIKECEDKLMDITNRIETIRASKLEMPESMGEMATAVMEQYEQLDYIMQEVDALVNRVLTNVKEGKEKFQQEDEGIAKEFRRGGGGRRRGNEG